MTDALDRLIEAVEGDGSVRRSTAFMALGKSLLATYVNHAANGGSIDAAKALHEALLPGWHYRITRGKYTPEAIVQRDLLAGEHASAELDIPARAWLLAIIRAYRAQIAKP